MSRRNQSVVDISGLDAVEVLRALYAGAHTVQPTAYLDGDLDRAVASALLDTDDSGAIREGIRVSISLVRGRFIRAEFSSDHLGAALFDREHGPGKAAQIVRDLRARGGVWE